MFDFFTTRVAKTVSSSCDPTIERLRAARAYLAASPDRWVQRINQHYQAVCSVEAIARAAEGRGYMSLSRDEVNRQAILELSKTLLQDRSMGRYLDVEFQKTTQPGCDFIQHVILITKFNDLGTTKYADVINLYDTTINRLCGFTEGCN
jgi:hypothetical protein